MKLAEELRRLRLERRLSLRQVERLTGVSNAYLSQLENRHVLNPSPHLLRKLAKAYAVSFERLMNAAGYSNNVGELPLQAVALLSGVRLTEKEEEQLVSFVRTLVSSKN